MMLRYGSLNAIAAVRRTRAPSAGIFLISRSSVASKPTFLERITGKAAERAQSRDLDQLQSFMNMTKGLSDVIIPPENAIFTISKSVRDVAVSEAESGKYTAVLTELEKFTEKLYEENKSKLESFSKSIAEEPDLTTPTAKATLLEAQLSLRILFLHQYFKHLNVAISTGDVLKKEVITADFLVRITDAILLGTASERLYEHMQLFGPTLSQHELQTCFYTMYDAEVASTFLAFKAQQGFHKQHVKNFPKFGKNYLLDTLELNTKSRSVFSWTDPEFSGFKPFPDEHRFPLESLISSRRKFFPDGESIASGMMDKYHKDRKWWYIERKEFHDNMKMGVVFFFATCFVDYFLCTM